jgi:hypothetical protein
MSFFAECFALDVTFFFEGTFLATFFGFAFDFFFIQN